VYVLYLPVTTALIDASANIQYDNIANICVALANVGTFDGINDAKKFDPGLAFSSFVDKRLLATRNTNNIKNDI
jgi:hypothetical protein